MSEQFTEVFGGQGSGGSGSGGIPQWNPTLNPDYIQAGKNKAPGIFVLNNDFNGIIDDISSSKKGTIIYFFKNTQRWAIISGEDKNKGVYSTYSALLVAHPTSTDGDYALITSTNSFFAYYNNTWNNTGSSVAPDALRSTNNLNDLTDKVASRINLGVDSTVQSDAKLLGKKDKITPITATTKGTASKTVTVQVNAQGDTLSLTEQDISITSTQVTDFTEASQDAIGGALLDTPTIDLTYNDATNKISADVKDLSLDNSKIATNADIETSKSKQTTITPTDAIFANGDKQSDINNKAQGQINAIKALAEGKENASNKVSAFSATPNNTNFPTEKLLKDNLDLKVNKDGSKVLSDNNFTNAYKSTLDNITEVVQDSVDGLLVDSSTIGKTYNDTANTLSLSVKSTSIDNSHISATANIETSKSKQSVITPVLATPQDNDTQEQINNKLVGLSNNLQSQIESRPIGASNGSVYYLTSQSSTIANYELLSFSPDPSALDIESVTINSTTAKSSRLIHSYIANADIGAAIINGGNWLFNLFGYVSHLNSSRFEIDVFKRVGTAETLLFTCETTDFLQIAQVSQALNIVNVETTQQNFSCNSTDKIVIKVYGKTDRTQDTTITLLHSGTEYASHIHTPLITSHNNLSGTQGGNSTEKYHLTLQEYNNVQALPSNLNLKQNITDNLLNTTAKTIVEAINEVKASNDLKANQSTTYTKTENDASFLTKVDKVLNKSLISDTEIARLLTMATNATSNQTDAYLLDRANHTSTQAISTIVGLQASLDAKANDNTVVKLTGNQTIAGIKTFTAFPVTPASLPTSQYEVANKQYVDNSVIGGLKYQGTWNALTNTPALSNGTSTNGYFYRVNVAGTQNFGAGNISFAIDDKVVYNPSNVWEKWDTSDEVASVNTKTGAIVLNQDEILDGANYKQYSLTEKTKLAGIQSGAEVNVQADYAQTDNTQDNFIKNKPTLGTVASKNVGTAIGNIQENGAILGNSQTVETDATGKYITVAKNDAYNKSFGTSAGTVAQGNDLRFSTNLSIDNKTGTTLDILSSTGTDITVPQATTTEAGLLSAADKLKINNSLTTKNVKILYVSCGINGSGNDSNDGLSELTALGTLAAANTKADGTGVEIRQLPSQSTESVTFTQANLQFSGTTYRANSGTTGTITANPSSGSQTYSKYSFANFVKSGANNVVMRDITVSNSLSNTGTGSLDIYNSDLSITPLSFTGAGTTRLYNCRGGVPIVNNANAFVYIGNNQNVGGPTLTAGTLALENCIVYVAQGTTLTLGSVGTTISLNNVRFIYPDSTEAAINIPVGASYSLAGINLYKSTSTLSGTDISSYSSNYIQNVKINTLNLPKLTASQRLETDGNKNVISVAKGTADNQDYSTIVGDLKANGTASLGVLAKIPRIDHVHPTDTSRAPIDSPSFTGTPLVPTAAAGTNTTQIASTEFVTTGISMAIASLDVMVFKGVIDASTNPNYPAGDAGHTYRISVAGKIGGASGINVEAGDLVLCLVDGTVSGNQATVGTKWNISQVNIDGAVISNETVSTDNDFIVFSGTSGNVVKKVTLVTFKTLLALSKTDVGLNNVPNIDATNPANIAQNSTYRFVSDIEKAGYLTKADNLNSVANKQTAVNNLFNVAAGSGDNGKVPIVVNGDIVLTTPGLGGNVSATGVNAVVGAPMVFGNTLGTSVIAGTNTAAQRQIYSKAQNLVASYTSTERDTLTWVNGDTIYNSTNGFAETYNGTTWIQNYRDTTDFVNWIANGVNAGGTLVGNAIWGTALGGGSKNGVLLTTATNNQKGFWYKAIPQIAHKRIVLYADHVSGSGTGADGIFYSIFANTPPTTSNVVDTANNSYTIFFNEYLDEVSLRYNGTILQTVPFVGLDSTASDIKQVRIVIDYNPLTNLSRIFAELKGAGFGVGVCIDYNDTVARNLTGQYVFACGYTFGQNNFHEVHHLAIRKFYEY